MIIRQQDGPAKACILIKGLLTFQNTHLTIHIDFDKIIRKETWFCAVQFYSCGVLRFFFNVYDVIQILFTILIKSDNHPALKSVFPNHISLIITGRQCKSHSTSIPPKLSIFTMPIIRILSISDICRNLYQFRNDL